MCRRSDRACRPARGHERALCNNMAEECQSMGKQGCPGGCKATDARRVVSGAPGARGTRPPRAISTPPPTVGRARTVVANPRNRDSDGGGKLRNLFAAYLHPPPSADLHQGEVLSLRDHHKRILRPILGLGRDRYVFSVYHHCWLVTTPGVLISGYIGVGVIFSGRKGGYL